MTRPRIAIEDHDGQQLGAQLRTILQRETCYRVELLEAPLSEGKRVGQLPADLIIPVLPTSKDTAVRLLGTSRAEQAHAPLLPVLKAEDLDQMLDELGLDAQDFLLTPLRAVEVLARVRRLLRVGKGNQAGVNVSSTEAVGFPTLIGEDPAFLAVKAKLLVVARCEAPVLLTGETGTGKELCARIIHCLSRRAAKPFLPVNCGAIPVELFESELFGREKGAFTGASTSQRGFIAEAEGGTLFLDEIQALCLGAQVKLLRFLEDQTYHILGSPRLRRADVRVIASTNVELAHKVRDGTIREDLLYRLAVLTLALPPLRERRGDVPLLVTHLWPRYAGQQGEERRRLSPRAVEALCQYDWPGNIRELENILQQVAVLTDAQTIEPEHLPIPPRRRPVELQSASLKQTKAQLIAQVEKAYVLEFLQTHQGNVSRAARAAQMERRAFGRLIKKYQLSKH